jgi:hypothetical protein
MAIIGQALVIEKDYQRTDHDGGGGGEQHGAEAHDARSHDGALEAEELRSRYAGVQRLHSACGIGYRGSHLSRRSP